MELIQMARDLGKQLQETKEYKEYWQAKASYDSDQNLQEHMEKLTLLRLQLQSLTQQDEIDKEQIEIKNKELQEVFGEISGSLTMQSYHMAGQKLNELLQAIQSIISAAANGEDPETFDPSANCSGNCGSCSGQCQ